MSARRIAVGLLVAVVGIGSIFWAPAFGLLVLCIAIGGSFEFAQLARRAGADVSLPVAIGGSSVYVALAFFQQMNRYEHGLIALVAVAAVTFGLAQGLDHFGSRVGWTVFAVLYLGKLLSYMVVVRQLHNGAMFTLWIVVVVVVTDVVGMFVGLRYGRHKLWAQLSPSKTWEGAFAAFVAACVVGVAFGLTSYIGATWPFALAFSAVIAFAAQVGDLTESAFKRDAHVKDSGQLIADHGGVLDRFDSYALAGAAAYVLLLWAGRV